MLLLLLLHLATDAQRTTPTENPMTPSPSTPSTCGERTSIYGGELVINIQYYAYDPRTYLNQSITMTRDQYRALIQRTIPCTGFWCIDSQWKCIIGDSRNCYNVEHIIPSANSIPEIAGCSTDVRGNYIMAYGAWNQALSNHYYGEKAMVYGDEIMKSAYAAVHWTCKGAPPQHYPAELCLNQFYVNWVLIGLGILLSAMIFCAIAVFTHCFGNKDC